MGASDYLESKIINHLMRTDTWAKTTARWISLHLESPYDDATGIEVSGGAYARSQLDADDANWSEEGTPPYETPGESKNLAPIVFPAPSGADWGVVTATGVWDDPTAGNLLAFGNLVTPVEILDGDSAPSFPTGAVTVRAK